VECLPETDLETTISPEIVNILPTTTRCIIITDAYASSRHLRSEIFETNGCSCSTAAPNKNVIASAA